MKLRPWSLPLLPLLLVACDGSDLDAAGGDLQAGCRYVDEQQCIRSCTDSCVTGLVTIQQGVCGQLIQSCDVCGCEVNYAAPAEVRVYDQQPGEEGYGHIAETDTSLTPIGRVTSDARGFFQLSLPPGEYYLCTNGSCARAIVSSGAPVVRRDYASGGPGSFWWDASLADGCTG
jgi:hypothetical protein